MVRKNRVLSFISQWSASPRSSPSPDNKTPHANAKSSTPRNSSPENNKYTKNARNSNPYANGTSTKTNYTNGPVDGPRPTNFHDTPPSTPPFPASQPRNHDSWSVNTDSPPLSLSSAGNHSRNHSRSSSRPLSMVITYHPLMMDVTEDTIPELQPIFHFLNGHANKLYQEGYFLKLDDQNTQGKPNHDRTWTECFAQLVGTVLSLWDAAELDAAGENGEVLPKFINLTDASIKMIDSLPTRSNEEQPLQNILSISTAGRNRYLLHFNSRHSLIQWTAGIRLAMFEYSSLQEAYTGALIAGRGKTLPNIGVIMERNRTPAEQWVRVRFGAGMPWKRCWCVISPPDEKEYMKLQKELKKKSPYDRSHPPILKGDIKFYDQKREKKHKKIQPIATITDAYSAYALYPQAKSLVDASTLIKIEGNITIHSEPPSSTEGFVFIMPEVGPGLSGFGMMLKYLFPTWDTFGLYGRPGKLVASVLDARSLMFAMPKSKRYGYLEILDVSGLILTEGSSSWTERDWRKRLKELTGSRMNTVEEDVSSPPSRGEYNSKRLSFGTATGGLPKPRVGFADDSPATRTSRSFSLNSRPPPLDEGASGQYVTDSPLASSRSRHSRNASDPSLPPQPPPHQDGSYIRSPLSGRGPNPAQNFVHDLASTPERTSSDSDPPSIREFGVTRNMATPEPVSRPPGFSHAPGQRPANQPYHAPEMRRATSRLSSTTLAQLAKAGGVPVGDDVYSNEGTFNDERPGPRGALLDNQSPRSPGLPPPQNALANQRSRSPLNQNMGPPPPGPRGPSPGAPRAGTPNSRPTTPGSQVPPGRGGPPTGGLPRIPPGRGPPPHNMPPGRGNPNHPPNMYRGPPHGPPGPGGPGQIRSPPPNRGPLPPLNTSPPIHRKPIPARGDSLQNRPRQNGSAPQTPSSNGSFTAISINSSVLNQIRPTPSEGRNSPRAGMHRNNTGQSQASSRYDDNASIESPDYASSRPSTDTAASVERPRAGVLRTVGNEDGSQPMTGSFDIPNVDFGPTLNYAALPKSKTPTPNMAPPPRSFSPAPRTHSPAAIPGARRSPGFNMSHNRQESEDTIRRSMVWQPASPPVNSGGGNVISPEQFVQQRAAAAATPLYVHQRQTSSNSVNGYRTGTPTPPLSHSQVGDYIGTAHSRSSSQDLLQRPGSRGAGELLHRPGSRGAGAVLGGQAGVDSHLSAREQEHVARVTGSPLINMAGNKNIPPIGGGLVGAIDAREREKEQMKQGWSSQAAQQAISQRQQQHAFQQYQQPMASPGLPPPSGMYSNMSRGMGGGPRSPPPPPQGYGMPNFAHPGPRAQEQGGWSSPALGYPSPSAGGFDPRFPPGQAMSPPPHTPSPSQQPGYNGQGGYYHGQAF